MQSSFRFEQRPATPSTARITACTEHVRLQTHHGPQGVNVRVSFDPMNVYYRMGQVVGERHRFKLGPQGARSTAAPNRLTMEPSRGVPEAMLDVNFWVIQRLKISSDHVIKRAGARRGYC